MFTLAVAFVSFSNNQITSDQTFCLFSKTLYVAALTKCTLESPTTKEIDLVIEAIKLSGNPQDYGILRTAGRDQEKAREALLNILTLRQ